VITFEFKLKNDANPLLVKDVPGVLYQKLVLLLLKVVVPDTFKAPVHETLPVLSIVNVLTLLPLL